MVGSFTINLGPLIANQSCCFLIAGVGPGFHPHVEVEGARKPRLCGPEPTGAALFFLIVYLDGLSSMTFFESLIIPFFYTSWRPWAIL